jgi:hypothetical protein
VSVEGASDRAGDVSKRHQALFLALVGAAALLASAIFANDWLQRAWLAKKWLFRSRNGLTLRGVSAGLACVSFAWLFVTWRSGGWRSANSAPLRWILPIAVAAWMLTWTIEPPTLVYDAQLAFCGALAAWCLLVAISARAADVRRRGGLRSLDILVCELAAVVLLAEVGLRIVRRTTDSSWLATASTNPAAWVRAHRLAPGAFFMGYRVNREGFVDVEPEEVLEKPHRVVCIGDSFSVGVVPHHLHYTTIAEKAFDDLEVYDAGVVNERPPGVPRGPARSALPAPPATRGDRAVPGNDIVDASAPRPDPVGMWTDRNEVLLVQVLRRLCPSEENEPPEAVADGFGSTVTTGLTRGGELSPAESEKAMPWLRDPMQEAPSVSAERFLYVEERGRASLRPTRETVTGRPSKYLEKIRELARAGIDPHRLIPTSTRSRTDSGMLHSQNDVSGWTASSRRRWSRPGSRRKRSRSWTSCRG